MDGQEPIMIFGRATGDDGAPVTSAALTLCDLSGDQLDRAGVDEGGHYQLVPPAGGTYLVICSSATHLPRASLVAVADRPQRHDLTLTGGGATLGGPDLGPVSGTVRVPREGHVTHDLVVAVGTPITGTVRSAGAERPVAEALATLVDEDGRVVGSVVTGDDGAFRFDDVAPGVHTITASGYAPVASEIEIGPGHPAEVVLSLVPPVVADAAPARGPADATDATDATDAAGSGDRR